MLTRAERAFSILHMRSADDRTALARIRDVAIAEFANNGVAGTSVRAIARSAGVSPGLVMHHFGSKDALRTACDKHVAAVIRRLKTEAMSAGASVDPIAAVRAHAEGPPLAKYLARTLIDGSPHVAELVDELVSDAEEYMEAGVASGMLKPTARPRERAALLTMWSLGALVLHEHVDRIMGVDITTDLGLDPAAGAPYVGAAVEILGEGLLTESAVGLIQSAFPDPTSNDLPARESA